MSEYYDDCESSSSSSSSSSLSIVGHNDMEIVPSITDSEEEKNVHRLFEDSTEENEKSFLQRTEKLIFLRSYLIGNTVAPYIITPDVPLKISSKKMLFKNDMMQRFFTKGPGSVEISNGKTYREVFLETGEWVKEKPLKSQHGRYGGKTVDFVYKDMYERPRYSENDQYITMSSVKDEHLFFRGPDGIVRAYPTYLYFVSNNLLYVKEYQGEIGRYHVYRVYLEFYPENKETLLLRSNSSSIFMHQCEWYECNHTVISHVRSRGGKFLSIQDGIIKAIYYYKGKLVLIFMNANTELLTLA